MAHSGILLPVWLDKGAVSPKSRRAGERFASHKLQKLRGRNRNTVTVSLSGIGVSRGPIRRNFPHEDLCGVNIADDPLTDPQ
jgi:hypothetical protein